MYSVELLIPREPRRGGYGFQAARHLVVTEFAEGQLTILRDVGCGVRRDDGMLFVSSEMVSLSSRVGIIKFRGGRGKVVD